MADYLDGLRIQGSSTLTTAPPQTSWKEIGRFKVSGGNTSNVTVRGLNNATSGDLTDKDNLMILYYAKKNSSANTRWRVDLDTNDKYAIRYHNYANNSNSLTDTAYDEQTNIMTHAGTNSDCFGTIQCVNYPTQPKLLNFVEVGGSGTGNTTPPNHTMCLGKYAPASNQAIEQISMINTDSGSFANDTEIVVLGANNDESDSGSNFWQELYSGSTTGASATNFTTDQFAKKNWLWVQATFRISSANGVGLMYFGENGSFASMGGANRYSNDGGAEGTQNQVIYGIVAPNSDGTSWCTVEAFVMNRSGVEKLVHSYGIMDNDSGSASSDPNRTTATWKYTADSGSGTAGGQLDILKVSTANGSNIAEAYVKVYGAD
tara:strand:+ start:1615 stop:2739 length:1125 start_codon:yes stop_codon:yes gene_type:complete